jgi:hypothetical protein
MAKNYTVIAPDISGLCDSSKLFTGYDGNTATEPPPSEKMLGSRSHKSLI